MCQKISINNVYYIDCIKFYIFFLWGEQMNDNVNIILEKIKVRPKINCGKQLIVMLSTNDTKLDTRSFSEAAEYIWEHNLLKILKVERRSIYIAKIYADVTV